MIFYKRHWKKILFLFVVDFVLIWPFIIKTSFVVLLPGGISPIEDLILIDNSYEQTGTINSTFIISYRNSTIFQKFICESLNETTTYDESNTTTSTLSNEEYQIRGEIMHNVSVTTSIISAYTEADKQIDYDFIGVYIFNTSDYVETFEIGDIIISTSWDNCMDIIDNVKNNPSLGIDIIRNQEQIKVYPHVNSETNTFGIYLQPEYVKYTINNSTPMYNVYSSNTSGPSGGLLQSLSIYNRLTELDYTHNLTIAGTGTIDPFGNVGEIGGIAQKIYTANYNKVDIFFIPVANQEKAEFVINSIKNTKTIFVFVSTLEETIEYLEGLNA